MNFNQKIYQITKKIPKGQITTYKAIAKKLNSKAYRAVGNALNKNTDKNIPCHRVIRSNGEIGGYNKGTQNKIKILKKEGIIIKNSRVNKKYLSS